MIPVSLSIYLPEQKNRMDWSRYSKTHFGLNSHCITTLPLWHFKVMLFEKLGQATSDVKISRKNRIQTLEKKFNRQ